MPTPDPRTPICVARGNLADLNASLADLSDGELCYAIDQNATYVKTGGVLKKVSAELPNGLEWDLMQYKGGEWIGNNQILGGSF